MATVLGPDIVTDGLVLAVDAGSENSYPGSGTTTTSLVGSNTGTLTNGVGFNSDNGGAFVLDGSNDYIAFNSNITLPTGNLTSTTWVKLDAYVSQNSTIGFSPDSGTSGFRIYAISTSSLGVWTRYATGGAVSAITTNNGLALNEWIQLTFVLSGSNGKFYKNGAEILSGTFPQPPAIINNAQVSISRYSGGGYHIDGKTANAYLYSRPLSATEVLQNYNAQKSRFI